MVWVSDLKSLNFSQMGGHWLEPRLGRRELESSTAWYFPNLAMVRRIAFNQNNVENG